VILKLAIATVLVEATAEIWVASFLFEKFRAIVKSKSEFLGYFVACGYCSSVWFGIGAAYLFQIKGAWPFFGWWEPLVWGIVVHRASNLWHEAIQRFLKRVPFNLFLRSWNTYEDAPKPPTPDDAPQTEIVEK